MEQSRFGHLEISEEKIRFKTATDFIITPYINIVSAQDGNVKRLNPKLILQ